ncbi:MAG: GNAT family N-acetyltransferase [Clostridia bacterium]|nr:GNAT family N-acetyltransferase [Clostridia bacterium]
MNAREKPCEIASRRLRLRPIAEGDRADMLRIFSSERVGETYMLPDFDGPEAMERLFRRFAALSQAPDRFVYGIALEGRLIGFLNETEKDEASIELGYAIHPDWQGRGFMTEALAAAMEALARMGYRAVRAGFFEGNEASRRVMEKCGLRPTGQTADIEYRGERRRCLFYEAALARPKQYVTEE